MKKLVGGLVATTVAAPALFSAFGWSAIIVCVGIATACTILIVKEIKKK